MSDQELTHSTDRRLIAPLKKLLQIAAGSQHYQAVMNALEQKQSSATLDKWLIFHPNDFVHVKSEVIAQLGKTNSIRVTPLLFIWVFKLWHIFHHGIDYNV